MKQNIKIIYMDDWTALYVDGKLAHENHTLSAKDVLNALEIPFDSVHVPYTDEYRDIREQLPEDYSNFEKLMEQKK